jgi:ribosome-associated heat shock protein Hsp15
MRLDQWLWAVRVYKSRTLAATAIKVGRVKVNGERSKPAYEPKLGDLITARVGIMTLTVRHLAAPKTRVGAKLVAGFAEDLTPPEERARRPEPNLLPPGFRPKGAGRPTKRERRVLGQLSESEPEERDEE